MDAVQYRTVQYRTVQFYTVKFRTVRWGTLTVNEMGLHGCMDALEGVLRGRVKVILKQVQLSPAYIHTAHVGGKVHLQPLRVRGGNKVVKRQRSCLHCAVPRVEEAGRARTVLEFEGGIRFGIPGGILQ